jgi:hypothetical protein
MFPGLGGVSHVSDEKRDPWFGWKAVQWVIDDAPVPADLAFTLTVIARRCNEHGCNSWQSVATIAAKAGKSEKQARRDIVRLRELGLIVLGDQSLVGHLPPGQRPTVYDVVMSRTGSKPAKESPNPTGGKSDTPPMDGTPPTGGTSPTEGHSTPPIGGRSTPPTDGSRSDHLDLPREETLLSLREPAVQPGGTDLETERDALASQDSQPKDQYQTQRNWLAKNGVTDPTELKVLPALIEELNNVDKPRAWWQYVHRQGDLPACIAEARSTLTDSGMIGYKTSGVTPHCGECELPNRWRYVDEDLKKPYRCPKCNPQRVQPAVTKQDLLDGWKPQGYRPYSDAGRSYADGEL